MASGKKNWIVYQFPNARPIFDQRLLSKAKFRPTSKGGGVEWDKSVYYWWWRFMRLSETYKQTCQKHGRVRDQVQKQLYADFGNIFEYDDTKDGFRDWWYYQDEKMETNRGAWLFGYPVLSRVRTVDGAVENIGQNTLVVAIPLDLRKREITKQLNAILKKFLKDERGRRAKTISSARYVPLDDKVTALSHAYKAFTYRRDHPKAKLWEITNQTGISSHRLSADTAKKRGRSSASADQKAYMASHANRILKKAQMIVDSVGQGAFPRY